MSTLSEIPVRAPHRARRRLTVAAIAVVLVLVAALGAIAYWTTGGTGTASASTGSLDAATISAPGTSSGTVTITWDTQAAMTPASQSSAITYTVERKVGSGSFAAVVGGPCSGSLPRPTTSCTDTVGASGTYTYRVVARFSTAWTATSNEVSVAVTVDTTSPAVDSITRADPSPTSASTVQWTVAFSEDVTGVDATDFDLVGSGSTSAAITGVSGSSDEYMVTVDVGDDGVLGLNLADDDSIEDLASNELGGTGTGNGDFTGETYSVDRTAPVVSSITRDGATPTNAGTVSWAVTFSENVSGVDLADFALTASGLNGSPSLQSVVAIDATTYTVTSTTGIGTPSGSGTLRLDVMDDDSIVDGLGNRLGGTGTGNGNFTTGQAYTIDKTQPTAVSIGRKAAAMNPTNVGPLDFTVTFSEPVSNVGTANFSVTATNTGGTAPSVASATPVGGPEPATTWIVAVATTGTTGANSGSIRLDLTSTDTIGDLATNLLAGTRNGDESFTYDTTQPTVISINRKAGATNPTNAGPLEFTVTFSEPVDNVAAANFVAATSNVTGTPAVSAPVATGGAPSTTWTVALNMSGVTGADNGSAGLNLSSVGTIRDVATNVLAATRASDQSFTYDTTQPTVTVEQKADQADPTNTLPIRWTVTFSEPVTGFDATDLARGGTTTGGTVAVTGTGTAYEISLSGTPTNGTTTFAIGSSAALDAAGNSNTASTSSDNSVTYDTVAPSTTITLSPGSPNGTNGWYKGPSAPSFALNASDSLSGVATRHYKIDGGATQSYGAPVSIPDGSHTITYWSVDNAGNVESSSTTATIKVDITDPTGSLTAPSAGNTGGTITLTSNSADATSGVASATFQRSPAGAGTWTDVALDTASPYSTTIDTTSLANGSYDLRVVTTDVAGNTFTSGTVTITVSNTFQVQLAVAGTKTAGTAFTVNITALANGVTNTSYTGPKTVVFSDPGNAPDGTAPTYPASVTFASGVGSASVTLFKAETATLTATQGNVSGGVAVTVVGAAISRFQFTSCSVNGGAVTSPCPASVGVGNNPGNVVARVSVYDAWLNPKTVTGAPLTVTLNNSAPANYSITANPVIAVGATESGTFTVTHSNNANSSTTVTTTNAGFTQDALIVTK